MDLIITTAQQPSASVIQTAKDIAAALNSPFVERNRHSLAALKEQYQVSNILVATTDGPIVHTNNGEYFFHLSMAELRIKNIMNGKHDHMVTSMGLTPGMSVLDCTLGLATDAIVASFVTGESGQVIGLENSPIIALITRLGLQNFTLEPQAEYDIISALRRIEVKNADYFQYLTTVPDNSFDIVYFDPMFRHPIYKSSNLKPIRNLADKRSLTPEALKQACRIAKRRVVVKEAADSSEFSRLGITTIFGGKYSSIKYGVIDCRCPDKDTGGQLWND